MSTTILPYIAASNAMTVSQSGAVGPAWFMAGGFLAVFVVVGLAIAYERLRVAHRAHLFQQKQEDLREQAAELAAEMEAKIPGWGGTKTKMEKARLLYTHVEGNRQRFLELAPGIPLTPYGAATYFFNLQAEKELRT